MTHLSVPLLWLTPIPLLVNEKNGEKSIKLSITFWPHPLCSRLWGDRRTKLSNLTRHATNDNFTCSVKQQLYRNFLQPVALLLVFFFYLKDSILAFLTCSPSNHLMLLNNLNFKYKFQKNEYYSWNKSKFIFIKAFDKGYTVSIYAHWLHKQFITKCRNVDDSDTM